MAQPVNARATIVGADECRLTWEAADQGQTPASLELRYFIQYTDSCGIMGAVGLVSWTEAPVPRKQGAWAHVSGLEPSTRYRFRVVAQYVVPGPPGSDAVAVGGRSKPSNAVRVTTLSIAADRDRLLAENKRLRAELEQALGVARAPSTPARSPTAHKTMQDGFGGGERRAEHDMRGSEDELRRSTSAPPGASPDHSAPRVTTPTLPEGHERGRRSTPSDELGAASLSPAVTIKPACGKRRRGGSANDTATFTSGSEITMARMPKKPRATTHA